MELTRRQFLLCFTWLPFFRRRRVSIAGIRFRVVGRGGSSRRYLWIHGDERTAGDILLRHMRSRRGPAFLTESRERFVPIEGGRLDPNRMFSRAGAQRNLRRLNAGWTPQRLERALKRLDRDREKFVRRLLPPPGGLLVALHNNARGYSVQDEVPISNGVALNDASHPHEFLLCTSPPDFRRLSGSPFNVVLQSTAGGEDDGSLSRLAASRGVRYVNIEAGIGESDRQAAMLAWVETNLP